MLLTVQAKLTPFIQHCYRKATPSLTTIPSRALYSTGATPSTEQHYGFDPYNYTSGRWLRNNKQELELRHINFDFDALSKRVLSLSNATRIRDCSKIEGGSNFVFAFTLDNGQRSVAKLPFKIAGPAGLTTASEVGTITYLQQETQIPIPKILDWSANTSNSIRSEYIISEHAAGTNLHFKWPEMTTLQRVRCLENIYRTLKDAANIRFPVYGSIYFANTSLDNFPTHEFDQGFVIGPHCGTRYWDCGSTNFFDHWGHANPGPWKTMTEFAHARIDTGLAKLPPSSHSAHNIHEQQPPYHGTITSHKTLLDQTRPVLTKMSKDPQISTSSTPTLFHPDLHKRNIFVSDEDPGVVTAIIDWQGSAVEPAFWYRWDVPDFAGRGLQRPFAVPPDQEDLEFVLDRGLIIEDVRRGCEELDVEMQQKEEETQQQQQQQIQMQQQDGECGQQQPETADGTKPRQELRAKPKSDPTAATTAEESPKEKEQQKEEEEDFRTTLLTQIHAILTHHHLPTLTQPTYNHENIYRPFIVPANTWSHGLPELEHELIELGKDWSSLGFQGQCPFPELTPAELEAHAGEYEDYKAVIKMRADLCEQFGVGSDGYGDVCESEESQGDVWEEREKFNEECCRMFLEILMKDEEIVDKEGFLRAVWPFDVKL